MSTEEPFGKWMRQQRTQVLGWTQAELAREVYCSEAMIRKVERGERQPARDLAERLLRALRVPDEAITDHVAWARGLAGRPAADNGSSGLHLSGSGYTLQTVLVPLDAIASFGEEQPRVVRLSEPFLGRMQWAAVPLASLVAHIPVSHCRGDECNGRDAEEAGCAEGSLTVDGADIIDPASGELVAMLELRFSRVCQTNWVRITRFVRSPLRMEAYLRDGDGTILEPTRVVVPGDQVYGYGGMWYTPKGAMLLQACAVVEGIEEVRTRLST
jgi:transcriptional regulator with XRE-family HTH domain